MADIILDAILHHEDGCDKPSSSRFFHAWLRMNGKIIISIICPSCHVEALVEATSILEAWKKHPDDARKHRILIANLYFDGYNWLSIQEAMKWHDFLLELDVPVSNVINRETLNKILETWDKHEKGGLQEIIDMIENYMDREFNEYMKSRQ